VLYRVTFSINANGLTSWFEVTITFTNFV